MILKNFMPTFFVLGITFTGMERLFASESLNFEHFNMENGLSQNTINDIIQDDYGFMWFGTKDGLNRFDGLAFKIYRHIPNDLNSLGSSYILSLCKGADGVLWVGTDAGIYAYDSINDNFTSLSISTAEGEKITGRVNDIRIDKNNNLWLTAGTQGIFRYDRFENRLHHYDIDSR